MPDLKKPITKLHLTIEYPNSEKKTTWTLYTIVEGVNAIRGQRCSVIHGYVHLQTQADVEDMINVLKTLKWALIEK